MSLHYHMGIEHIFLTAVEVALIFHLMQIIGSYLIKYGHDTLGTSIGALVTF